MTISDSRLAFADCEAIWEKAWKTDTGVRVHVVDYNSAVHLRMRLHQCRKIDRRENRAIYPEGVPMHGGSAWDAFVVRLKEIDGEFWVYIEKQSAAIIKIESIDELPAQEQIEHEPQKLLVAPTSRRRV